MHVSRKQWVFKKCGRVIYRKGHKELNAGGKFHWATDFDFFLRITNSVFYKKKSQNLLQNVHAIERKQASTLKRWHSQLPHGA
jgi:hypothetical protein